MTVRDPVVKEPVMPCNDKTSASLSPCKRQRLDDECDTEPSGSVEDILRDISTRCNAVLHNKANGPRLQQEPESIRMYGSFSALQTSVSKSGSMSVDGAEEAESDSSFRTSVREHCTIRTQVFPHGHAFTSRTKHGGYRFRWVPNHSWNLISPFSLGAAAHFKMPQDFQVVRQCGWATTANAYLIINSDISKWLNSVFLK